MKFLKIIILIVSIFCIALFAWGKVSSARIGLATNKALKPCPSTPNCVIINYNNELLNLDISSVQTALENIGGEIITTSDNYIHGVFTSTLFRFKDDFEVLLSSDTMQFKSASRTGKSDLGVNAKRVKRVEEMLDIQNN